MRRPTVTDEPADPHAPDRGVGPARGSVRARAVVEPARLSRGLGDVAGLRPLGAVHDLELDVLSLLEGAKAIALDG